MKESYKMDMCRKNGRMEPNLRDSINNWCGRGLASIYGQMELSIKEIGIKTKYKGMDIGAK